MNSKQQKIKPRFQTVARGNFIDGCFSAVTDPNGEWISQSPADTGDQLGRISYSYIAIEHAIAAARKVFSAWSRKSQGERANLIKKYAVIIQSREEEIAEVMAREIGKPLWEAKQDLAAMAEQITILVSEGLKWVADFEAVPGPGGAKGFCRYKPLGVLAVMGPFSSAALTTNGQIISALLAGNTVVFKPSEKAGMIGQILTECFQEAGLPAGVLNLVQGEKEVGRRLCVNEGIDGVLFTGSNEVGTRIKQDTLQQHWKLISLQMGAKNPAIICDDTNIDAALMATVMGAFTTTGQRCTSTSRVLVQKKIFDQFLTQFHERAKAFKIGHPLDNPFMGPLIDRSSVERYMKFQGIASREGCELVMRGKALDISGLQGHYVTPSICWAKLGSVEAARKSVFQQTEILAPSVVLTQFDEVEEAIALANITQYGLVASVFTANRTIYEKCLDGLQFGLINWNKSTLHNTSALPFCGLKKSGNHFPAALLATRSCVTPIASLETSESLLPASKDEQPGGLNWQ